MLTCKLHGDVTRSHVSSNACVYVGWKHNTVETNSVNSTNGEYKLILDVNRATWKSFGVNRNKTSVPHLTTPDRQLYFMPDVPHLIKCVCLWTSVFFLRTL